MQAASAETQDTIEIREYHPDGGFAVGGILSMGAALVLAGIVLGVAGHYISRMIWLIVLFPAGMGMVMGLAARGMVRYSRMRSPAVAGALGLVGGFAAMFVMHYQDYSVFRSEVARLPAEFRQIAQLPADQQQAALKEDLKPEEIAQATTLLKLATIDNMLDYMNWEAEQGVRIGRATSSSDRGTNLGFTGSWIYWGIEVLIVAGITYAMAKEAAAQPFCVACDQWKPYRLLGCFTGAAEQVQLALNQGAVAKVRELGPVRGETNVALKVAACPKCGTSSDVELKLDVTTVNGKGEKMTKTVLQCSTPGSSVPALQTLFAPPPAPAPTPTPPLPTPRASLVHTPSEQGETAAPQAKQ